jgi:hypothetical protein
MPAIRYQVMAMEDELEGPMTVTAISWLRSFEGDDWAVYYDVELHMGLCGHDDLFPQFDLNWIPGTKELVFQTDSLYLSEPSMEWLTLTLDQPFVYPGTGNLLLELTRRDSQDTNLFSFRWYTENTRTVLATHPDAGQGYADQVAAMLKVDYLTVWLSRNSWAGIKGTFSE